MHLSILLGLISLFIISQPSFAWTSWVGVLEDWPTKQNNEASSQRDETSDLKYEPRIRPLFIRTDKNKWTAAPRPNDQDSSTKLPKAFSWDVCFSGRGEGQLTSMLQPDSSSATTPPYILRSEDKAPWRTRRSTDYAGYLTAPVYKPILLMSSLNSPCKDPEKWKPSSSERVKHQVPVMIAELRKFLGLEENGIITYDFLDKDVKVYRAWSAAKKGTIVALKTRLKDSRLETFQLDANGSVTYLGRDMMLIDAGDFDGDGSTELLFKRRAEKRDVYDLVSQGIIAAESIWDYP